MLAVQRLGLFLSSCRLRRLASPPHMASTQWPHFLCYCAHKSPPIVLYFFFLFALLQKLSCTLPPSPPLGCCLVRCVCTLWDLDPTVCGCLCNWCEASQRQPSDSAPYLRRRFQQTVCSLPVCDTLSCLNTQLQVQGTRRLHNQIFAANI